MRSRLSAVLLLLSAFLLGPGPGIHPPASAVAAAASAGWWWGSPAAHEGQDMALLRSHLARGVPDLLRPHPARGGVAVSPLWPAVLPSGEQPRPRSRPVAAAAEAPVPEPRPAGRRAPARAPPSTTR
ncbi:hypothetical protein Nocox_19870 [Nonomuraea coxensis DSM 45129]|uniref:Uncharacterized protein n=1 Tax=Nonomuraea coxensis DSM 45129 TaxID=1122611 RepID=A0ABX8U1P8_9ACTN|nr:hypothetical protein [Nonomuraea coxensis]QYC41583.1 hypothetical protein Nocox_19870 [Nonomuraea coxensis DSM 45129]